MTSTAPPGLAPASTPIVKAVGLTKTFEGPPSVTALVGCDIEVSSGEMVAVTGASGSGKSTLMSLLGLLEVPTAGDLWLAGIDVARASESVRAAFRARQIGFIFQAFHLIGFRSSLSNVELGMLYQGLADTDRRERAARALDRVGLTARTDALCSTLSGGEKQRVAIARAIAAYPKLILCDEPTGNLDSVNATEVMEILCELAASGVAVVVVTHDRGIASMADRVLRLRDGEVVARGDLDQHAERGCDE